LVQEGGDILCPHGKQLRTPLREEKKFLLVTDKFFYDTGGTDISEPLVTNKGNLMRGRVAVPNKWETPLSQKPSFVGMRGSPSWGDSMDPLDQLEGTIGDEHLGGIPRHQLGGQFRDSNLTPLLDPY
jgi:hypothetical protein